MQVPLETELIVHQKSLVCVFTSNEHNILFLLTKHSIIVHCPMLLKAHNMLQLWSYVQWQLAACVA